MVGRRVQLRVLAFEWDDDNMSHLERHGVLVDAAEAVRMNEPHFFENVPDRTGTHVVVGPDSAGTFYFISIRPIGDDGVWRPVTGWRLGRRALNIYNSGDEP